MGRWVRCPQRFQLYSSGHGVVQGGWHVLLQPQLEADVWHAVHELVPRQFHAECMSCQGVGQRHQPTKIVRQVSERLSGSLSSAPERGLVQRLSVSWGEPSTKRSGELVPVLAGSGLQSGSEPFCLAPQPDAKKLCSAIGIPTVELGALDKILLIGVPVPLTWLPWEGFRHHHRSRCHVTKPKTTQSHGRNGEKRIELTSVCGPTNEMNQKKKKKERERKGRRNELAVDGILSTAPNCHAGKWWPNPVR